MADSSGKYDTFRMQAGATDTSGEELGPACSRYKSMEQSRRPYLDRARQCSELTLPYLIPPEGWTNNSDLRTPFQSIGSRGVNNLSSKLIVALFPANQPFARILLDGKAEDEAKQEKGLKAKVEQELAAIERKLAAQIERYAMRPHFVEGMRHLVVAGNILFHFPENDEPRVFRLEHYVVKRDPSGNLLEIVTKEQVSPKALDSEFYQKVKEVVGYKGDDKTCDIYTYVKREGPNAWSIFQEVHGLMVPGTEGKYTDENFPWLALRWNKIDGEDYGRGYVEDYLGDLQSAEGLSQSLVESAAVASKVLFLVAPNGTTKPEDLEKAPNGAVRTGNAADVTTVQVEKYNDLRMAKEQLNDVEKRLGYAFMLNSTVQRQGERVTAEEMRLMVADLEAGLGGIYSMLSHSFQLPLANLLLKRGQKRHEIPQLPKGTTRISIVTGLEAIGRGQDLQRLQDVVGAAIQVLTPQIFLRYANPEEYLSRLFTSANVDPTDLVKTDEEIQEMQQAEAEQAQQAQIMDLVKKLGPNVINGAADAAIQKGAASNGGPAEAAA